MHQVLKDFKDFMKDKMKLCKDSQDLKNLKKKIKIF